MAPGQSRNTLYTYPENFRAYKALIAAQYAGTDVRVPPNFIFGQSNKTEEFLKKFPSGKVPAFETVDGQFLNDSNAIAYYVANDQLRGKTVLERAQVLQWMNFGETEILHSSCAWVFPVLGIMQYNKQTVERAKEDIKKSLEVLNCHLAHRTFLVGERVSLADITLACNLLHLYTHALDAKFRIPFTNVNRWYDTVVHQPQFIKIAGQPKHCEKVAVIDPKKFEQNQQKIQQQNQLNQKAKDEKDKKKKEKQQQPQPKKEQAAEPAEEMDAAELALSLEPKSKDPFDLLPKGTFNMDDFKRCYSNEDEAKSIPYFWEKFDPENYSIWIGEYKYANELTKVFMSCNLITGMFQRLDKMRKQAFASVCLFGEDNNSTISGIWVWRGQELAFPLSPDWQIDYESYQWTKLNPADAKTKDLVKQYFSWTGADKDGRKFNQGKIFK